MAGETIAYVRVSTVEQNEERQVEMLKKIWDNQMVYRQSQRKECRKDRTTET